MDHSRRTARWHRHRSHGTMGDRGRRRRARRRVVSGALVAILGMAVPPAVAQEDPPPAEENADAEGCLPAASGTGDVFEPVETPDPDAALTLNGGGWGHGVGMSQYGAQGAASLGCSTETILTTYYPGVDIGPVPTARETIAVHLRRIGFGSTTITTSSGGATVPWVDCDVTATSCEQVAAQPAGTTWKVTPRTDGTFVLHDTGVDASTCPIGAGQIAGCHWRGGTIETRLRGMHDGTVLRVVDLNRRVRWGWIEFDHTTAGDGTTYVTQYVTGDPANGVTAIDRYLRGLAEVPSSWHPEALKSQAIAGRSYAEATIRTREAVYGRTSGGYLNRTDCRCDLFASTMDQVYHGWDHEAAETGAWRTAVDATAGQVMWSDGSVVAAFYSSSHGGLSENVEDVWGGSPISYLQAVDTSRWEEATSNSRQRWTRSFTASQLASRFGLATFTSFDIVSTGPGGRPNAGGIVVTGTNSAGDTVTRTYSGERIRTVLSLYSGNIRIHTEPEPEPEPTPEAPTEEPTEEPTQEPTEEPTAAPTEEPSDEPAPSSTEDPAPAPDPAPDEAFVRLAGDDGAATSVATSRAGWNSADTVLVARLDDPADALAGSTLAGQLGAPLLLTPTAELDDAVAAEIERLDASTAIVLGGAKAVSDAAVASIEALGVTVERIAGADRNATAVAVSERLDVNPDNNVVLLVRGRKDGRTAWADAIAVSAVAAARGRDGLSRPVLIADDHLPEVTAQRIAALKPSKIALIGGTGVLPKQVEDDLLALDIGLERADLVRYAGTDRWGTSRSLAVIPIGKAETLVVATGQSFADALVAGPYAARIGARLLLVPGAYGETDVWSEHLAFVRDIGWTDGDVHVVGARSTVATDVGDAVLGALTAR